MLRDLRFGARMLRQNLGFTLITILTLALGIGATSGVFSLIQGVLLTPPPYRDPGQLVLIPSARTDGQETIRPRGWAAAQWAEWQKEAKSFQAIAGYGWTFNFAISDEGSLFEVEPTDPATLAVVGLLFVAVALAACWIPMHRASKVDPLEALRYE